MHDYNKIASIVGEDKVQALRDAGVDIGDKPTQPTSDLLGRWAKDKDGNDVLIISDEPGKDGSVLVERRDPTMHGGYYPYTVHIESLTFPEQATRPEDVPVGEAWLVNVNDEIDSAERVMAVKAGEDLWVSGGVRKTFLNYWYTPEVTLLTPLVPARPQDQGQPSDITPPEQTTCPEDVTVGEKRFVATQEEYEALPVGSIVARDGGDPYVKVARSKWKSINNSTRTNVEMRGVRQVRQVLRRGWGK